MKSIVKYNLGFVVILLLSVSCDGFLDEKPDKKMDMPTTLQDCDALMDNVSAMNGAYPVAGEVACDDYYLTNAMWGAIVENEQRESYLWNPTVDVGSNQWTDSYRIILIANQVLDVLTRIDRQHDVKKYDRIQGQAYFYKAYALFQLAMVFTEPYDKDEAGQQMGMVLRTTPNIDELSRRATLKQTFEQIENDFRQAVLFLPERSTLPTRPSREAAHAALARTQLYIGDYEGAALEAEKALAINTGLIDYNTVSATQAIPFRLFNDEVIFHAYTYPGSPLNPSRALIDTVLYGSYEDQDRRKLVFFKRNSNGTHAFKGRYDGSLNASTFAGIGRDEVYLMLSESYIRQDRVSEGIAMLNSLLRTRWTTGTYVDVSLTDKDKALDLLLKERRKQLLFRNIRWMDLKRLSKDPNRAKELVRNINGGISILHKNDKRYAFLIPETVIQYSGITQNNR